MYEDLNCFPHIWVIVLIYYICKTIIIIFDYLCLNYSWFNWFYYMCIYIGTISTRVCAAPGLRYINLYFIVFSKVLSMLSLLICIHFEFNSLYKWKLRLYRRTIFLCITMMDIIFEFIRVKNEKIQIKNVKRDFISPEKAHNWTFSRNLYII